MEFSNEILQEIENDSKRLLQEMTLYDSKDKKTLDQSNSNPEVLNKKKNLLNKSTALLKRMQKSIKDEEYLIKGFGYHSNILYKLCTKFPFVGKTIGIPLMALTKAAVNNVPALGKIEREKILNLYTKLKGDKEAVVAKIEQLEKMKKISNDQKEQLILLKKMSAELDMNIKRLEFNYKLSHIEEQTAKMKKNKPRNYTF